VTSVVPARLAPGTATQVTVHGAGFDDTVGLSSETNEIAYSNVTRVDDETITATASVASTATPRSWWIGVNNAGAAWSPNSGSVGICNACVTVSAP
jgi:hypothetical protein